ncbi:MAG: 2-dehydropantoate 2-reductase [Pseudomonadota bacterium]
MRVLIVGAGATGGWLAERIAASEAEVFVLARGEHGRAIASRGLRITGVREAHIAPECLRPYDAKLRYDRVVLTTKCQDLKSALDSIRDVLSPDTLLLTIQNGVDAEEICAEFAAHNQIVAGVAYMNAFIQEPGVVYVSGKGRLAIGDWWPTEPSRLPEVQAWLEKAGIPTTTRDNVRRAKWTKLGWNSIYNPFCLLTRSTVGQVRQNPQLKALAAQVLAEIDTVAACEDVKIDPDMLDHMFGAGDSQGSGITDSRTSMWSDFIRGRPTEIDFLNGAVVRRGLRYGIPIPVNGAIVGLVHALEMSSGPP